MAGVSDEIKIRIITDVKQSIRELASLGISLVAIKRAFKEVVQFLSECEQAFFEQEKATAKLDAVLKSTGGTAGYTANQLKDMATQMQRLTIFDDETVMSAQAVLATFTKVGRDVFPKAIEAAADMSTVMGQDLQSSILQVGKALQDPILGVTALRRAGVMLTEEQKRSIKTFVEQGDVLSAQKIILAELNKEFGGAAKAMGDTAYGASVKLKNALGDLKEEMGRNVAQGLKPLREWLTNIAVAASTSMENMRALKEVLAMGFDKATTPIETLQKALEGLDSRLRQLRGIGGKDPNSLVGRQIKDLESQRVLLVQQIRNLETVAMYEKDPARLKAALAVVAVDEARAHILDSWNKAHEKEIELLAKLASLQGYRFGNEPEVESKRLELIKQIEDELVKIGAITKATSVTDAEVADLWGDINQYTVGATEEVSKFREHFAYIKPNLADSATAAKKLEKNLEGVAETASIAADIIGGDLLGSFESVLRLAGPEGQFAASLIDAFSGPIQSFVDELNGDTELAQTLGDAISGVFEQAMKSGDWDKVELALSDAIKDMVVQSIAESMLLAPYVEAFSRAMQRWLRNPSDRNWNRLQAAYELLNQAGTFAGGVAEGVIGQLESGGMYTPPVPSSSGRVAAGSGNTYVVQGSLVVEREVDRRIAAGYARKAGAY